MLILKCVKNNVDANKVIRNTCCSTKNFGVDNLSLNIRSYKKNTECIKNSICIDVIQHPTSWNKICKNN